MAAVVRQRRSCSAAGDNGAQRLRDQAGVLGAPGTAVLFGDEGLNEMRSNESRFGLDYWLTRDHAAGLEFQYFVLGQNTQSFQADDNSFPVLARPIFNTETQSMDSALIAYPGQTGNVNVVATSDLQGAEALLRKTWYCRPCARLDFLVGYRYVRLADDLRMDEFETFIDPAGTVPVGSTLALTDRFSTINEFQGADFGVASDWHYGRFDWGVLLKIGLGNTNSRVSISGNTVATEPTLAPVTTQGGLLAQASNIGQFEQNQFTMLPELGVNLGFDLTRRLRLTGGYSLLYWGGVAQSGDQIDLNVAPAQFPPSQNATAGRFPQFRFAATDYWAQGLSLGSTTASKRQSYDPLIDAGHHLARRNGVDRFLGRRIRDDRRSRLRCGQQRGNRVRRLSGRGRRLGCRGRCGGNRRCRTVGGCRRGGKEARERSAHC